jgi:L-alanine-DL-glutamate epimerase-like enolase superfamily enzyme
VHLHVYETTTGNTHVSPTLLAVRELLIAEQLRMFIDHQACDIIHPDVLFCGGDARDVADRRIRIAA